MIGGIFIKRYHKALLLAFFFIFSFATVLALASDTTTAIPHKVIRVAYPIVAGSTEVDGQGHYSGYTYEYLQEVAQYTGWEYEFVQIPGDTDNALMTLLDMLEKGEIDLMGGILYNETFMQKYDYSGYSFGTVYTVLGSLQNTAAPWHVGKNGQRDMRVAVLEDSDTRIEELYRYCQMNQITPELVVCESVEEQTKALREGRADTLLNVSLSPIEGIRNTAKFAPRPYYFMATKGKSDILSALDTAMFNIDQVNPLFSSTLYEKYFNANTDTLLFSDKEKNYIKQAGVLKVGVLNHLPPFQHRDEEGKPKGIACELLQYISQQTELSFEFVPVESQSELEQKLVERELDIVAGITYNYDNSLLKHCAMTRPYASVQFMMIQNKDLLDENLSGKKLALPLDTIYKGKFVGHVEWYDTQEDCIRAVNEGKADYTYADGYVAQFYANRSEFNNIRLIPHSYEPHQICLGVAKPVSNELLGILNKVILNMSTETMQTLVYQNSSFQEDMSLGYWMRENQAQSMAILSVIMLTIIGALAWGLRTRVRMGHKMALDMEKYMQVYELASEHFFEYNYATNKLIISNIENLSNEKNPHTLLVDLNKADPVQDQESIKEFLTFIKGAKESVEVAYLQCPDGQFHWLRFTIKTIYNQDTPAYAIGKIMNIDQEISEREALLKQAQRDSLTHLFNMETCRYKITEAIARLKPKENGALVLLDIDYFKRINDTYGHLEGDRILQQVAEVLRRTVPDEEIIGRPGGDEFTIYFMQVLNVEELKSKCEMICEQLRNVWCSDREHITCSIGVTLSVSKRSYSETYQKADMALYAAKRKGRDCVEIFLWED